MKMATIFRLDFTDLLVGDIVLMDCYVRSSRVTGEIYFEADEVYLLAKKPCFATAAVIRSI